MIDSGTAELGDERFSQMYDDSLAASSCFRLDPLFNTPGKNQQASLSSRVLNRCAHERVDQFLQDDFARHCLRDFDNGGEIQVFDRCPDRARRTGNGLFLSDVRV